MRKVFLDDLPVYMEGRFKERINWENSKGKLVKFIYDDIEGWIEIIDFVRGRHSKLIIKYNDEQFDMLIDSFQNCNIGNIFKKKTKEFKIIIGTRLQDEKRDITITNRKKGRDNNGISKKYYQYKCNKCGFDCGEHWNTRSKEYKDEYWATETALLKSNQGCSCCGGNQMVVKTINSIYKTDSWMIPYIGEECAKTHTYNSFDKVKVICPDCGRVKNKLSMIAHIHHTHSIACTCGDGFSYGHKYIFSLLNQLKQEFIDNYTFDWCKFYNIYKKRITTGEYDFVLDNIRLIIEMDGGFHRQDNNMNGQTKEESEFLDTEKDRLANEHGIEVIRISDEGDIKQNIFDSDLNKIFDLSNIDWLQCEEFALSNRVKESCKLWDSKKYSTKEIAEIMKLSHTTIIRFLTKGNDIGWCIYNGKEEQRKNGILHYINPPKPLIMFKNNIYLNIFESAMELERLSKQIFGVKLSSVGIGNVCNKKKLHHKGFTFRYTEDLTPEEYIKYDIKNKLKELHNNSYTYDIKYNNIDYKEKYICVTTNKRFVTSQEAGKYYNCSNSSIIRCCKGDLKSCGKLSDGTKLQWQYTEEYIKEKEIFLRYNENLEQVI